MRRFPLVLSGAVLGLAGLIGVKAATSSSPTFALVTSTTTTKPTTTTSVHTTSTTAGQHSSSTTSQPATTTTTASRSTTTTTVHHTTTTTVPVQTTTSTTTTTVPTTTRSATGAAVNYNYGTLSVEVTVTGSKIDKVTIASLNDGGNFRSEQIDQMSIPTLEQEALSAQSANIQSVSGASYTSAGFKESLQSALTKLGL